MKIAPSSGSVAEAAGVFLDQGFAILDAPLTADDLDQIALGFPLMGPRVAGAREADFAAEHVDWLRTNATLAQLASALAGAATARLSRILAFDKSSGANWFVPWHQDRAEGGVDRPVAELERRIALRIHLDDCDAGNGPLEMLPATHLLGRLEADAIALLAEEGEPVTCLARRGDIIAMRPLALHRSQRATTPGARRVLHIEYVT